MAEEIIVNGVGELLKKLGALIAKEVYLAVGVKDDLKKLQLTLPMIQSVVEDAEKQQLKNKLIALWLKRLRDVAYEAEDILDEFSYEALHQKLNTHDGKMMNKVCNFFSTSNPIAFRFKMAHKIKDINRKFDKIVKEIAKFELIRGAVGVATYVDFKRKLDRETHSFVDHSKIIGREVEKSKLVALLTDSRGNQEQLLLIPIVGLGGIGKTTLAQMVYDDMLVKEYFRDLRMWVCVSEDFSVKRVVGAIIESAGGRKHGDDSSLDMMACELQEKLNGKRFLLVLDDVWNEDHEKWEKLRNLLLCGVKGSKVLVTTRKNEVALMMGTLPIRQLSTLADEESWSLFKQRAFGNRGCAETPSLVAIGKKIVKKCGGVPLAINVLGGMLQSEREEAGWLSVLNSEIWDSPKENNGILQALKLSYDHLPSYLKQCFAFCSIFRKDEDIKTDKLIQLWMAEGLLQPPNESSVLMEDVGRRYIDMLLSNSLFQGEQRNEWGDLTHFKMHDLVHDLATSVSRFECSILEADKVDNIIETRRLQVCYHVEKSAVPVALDMAKKLRIIILSNDVFRRNELSNVSLLMNLKSLRVLDLSRIGIKEVPDSIVKLKHLRYLDLSATDIKVLPVEITKLYFLQTLKVANCKKLTQLPNSITELINLRHLKIKGLVSEQTEMPKAIGQLRFLQTLPLYRIDKERGRGISELKYLDHLRGELEIQNLENVRGREDAYNANLEKKQNIRRITLTWGWKREPNVCVGQNNDDDEVLEGLQPHQNLKGLHINGFWGMKYPTWLQHTLFCNLVEVKLRNCPKCECVPAFGQFPFLRYLSICDMDSLKRIGSEFYGVAETTTDIEEHSGEVNTAFPSLLHLELDNLKNLEEWAEVPLSSSFSYPSLEGLCIRGCYRLRTMPTLFSPLKNLVIDDSNSMAVVQLATGKLASLVSLQITGISDLAELPKGFLENCKLLQRLDIENCPKLRAFPDEELQCLTALEYLKVGGYAEELNSFSFLGEEKSDIQQKLPLLRSLKIVNSKRTSLPDQIQHLTRLQRLTIEEFPNMVALPEWVGNFPSLQGLRIESCKSLMHMPSVEAMQRLTALQRLNILKCPHLNERCAKDRGQEWCKISHIPLIHIDRDLIQFVPQSRQ